MGKLLSSVFCAVLLSASSNGAPALNVESGTSVASSAVPSQTVLLASDNPNGIEWNMTTDAVPQPIRGSLGATILAQQNVAIDRQNPDLLAPPTTDHGMV